MKDRQVSHMAGIRRFADWPTLVILVATYLVWGLATVWIATWSLPIAIVLCAVAGAQHSSLSHEMLHGHPFRNPILNAALVFPALTIAIPYMRFRDTHLAHHKDDRLTDPYDDPESNYLDPAVWATLPKWRRGLHRVNNTLAGRLIFGPAIGQVAFMACDWRLVRQGDRRVLLGWLLHIPAVALVIWWMLAIANMPIWAWALSVYAALSLLKLRTYLEHQADVDVSARTAIVEDRGFFALLFLNNNLHVVHHMHPRVPWYALPKLYRAEREDFLSRNRSYKYRSYTEIFRKHLFRAKDPVPHPLYPDGQSR